MHRTKPTTSLDVIGNFQLRPEEAVGDYIESKQQEKYHIKPPNWDSPGDSIELLAVQNDREHQAMLKLQEQLVENDKHQKMVNWMHIEELYKMQANLKRRFIEVNIFIKDCDDKRVDAEKKVLEEKQKHVEFRRGIEHFHGSADELTQFREELQKVVDKFEPYERVMEDVIENSDFLASEKDCMDRCDALMIAQTEIVAMQQEKLQEIEDLHKKMIKITNEVTLTVLGLKNDLAHLERAYNFGKSECGKWEKIMATAKENICDRHLERTRVLDGIRQMYLLVCKRLDQEPQFERHEFEKQMDFIKEEIEILQAVVKDYP